MKSRRTVLSTATLTTLAAVALSVPVGCDDPELLVDEEVLLSDDPDAVDEALEAAADLLSDEESEWTPRASNSAGNFSGSNVLSVTRKFGATTRLSMDAWVFRTGTSGLSVIGSQHYGHFGLGEANGRLQVLRIAGVAGWCDTGLTIPASKWTHVAMTFDSAVGIKVYLNGILQTQPCTSTTALPDSTTSFGVGSAGGSYHFPGYIDQVRVWNTTRTAAEIQQHMFNTNTAQFSTGLKAYYRLDGSGADLATGGVALNVTGAPWRAEKAPIIAGTVKYNTTTKRAYMASTTTAAWATARTNCAGNTGWTLVTINDATEDTYIDGTVLGGTNTSRYWIGYNDADNNGTYVWANGEAATYKDGTPALTKGQCMADNTLVGTVYDTWAPRVCTELNRFICEYRFL